MALDTVIFDRAEELLGCVESAIEEAGLPGFCRVCVVPGEIADDECEAGLLAITTTDIFPSNIFPSESTEDLSPQSVCGAGMMVADWTLRLMRCAPIPKGLQAKAPSCEELREAALLWHKDAYHTRYALLCCLRDMRQNYITSRLIDYRLGRVTASGPAGACVGFDIQILAGFIDG